MYFNIFVGDKFVGSTRIEEEINLIVHNYCMAISKNEADYMQIIRTIKIEERY